MSFSLSSITEYVNYKMILGVVLVILLIIISYYAYKYYTTGITYTPNNENGIPGEKGEGFTGKKVDVILWYAKWCPACNAIRPDWNEIRDKYDGKKINGSILNFVEIDCSENTGEASKSMDENNIEGFPTVKVNKDGEMIDLDAKPTKDTLETFLHSVV